LDAGGRLAVRRFRQRPGMQKTSFLKAAAALRKWVFTRFWSPVRRLAGDGCSGVD